MGPNPSRGSGGLPRPADPASKTGYKPSNHKGSGHQCDRPCDSHRPISPQKTAVVAPATARQPEEKKLSQAQEPGPRSPSALRVDRASPIRPSLPVALPLGDLGTS